MDDYATDRARDSRIREPSSELPGIGPAAGRGLLAIAVFLLMGSWQCVRLVICALLILMEPVLRVVLVPLAFLGFVVTLLFGFAMDAPNFPKWGMLAFSVGALLLYWLYLGAMSLFMRLPR